MKMMIKAALILVLAFSLLLGGASYAYGEENTEPTASETVEENMSILDEQALTDAVEELLASYGVTGDRLESVSFAYTYLATGDSWYYNGDNWFYPGSMYKVPMMMVLAEREAKGELTQESDVGGVPLAKAEEYILVWSNNDYAHMVRRYLGGDDVARKLYQAYSPLEESYYHSDFIDYCYFTARYMNDVMTTLYSRQQDFPHIMDWLKVAMPENFYHIKLDPGIEIAQKYGSYLEFNNNTGIIFSKNPFVLTVMSDCFSYEKAEMLTADAAKLFYDYTLSIDTKLENYQQELEQAKLQAEEEARLAREEEERLAREEAQKEEAARKKLEEEKKRQQEEAEAKARREELKKKLAVGAGAALVIGLILLILVRNAAKRRRERELAWRREMQRRHRYGLEIQEEERYSRSARRGRASHKRRRNYRDDDYSPRH